MPEGDDIRRDAARIGPLLLGRPLLAAASRWPALVTGLVGAQVLGVEAVGKHLLLTVDDGTTIRVHRGMTGTWRWTPAGQPVRIGMGMTSLRLEVAEGTLVARHAPTVERFRTRERSVRPALARLGPDVLGEGFEPAEAAERARASVQPTAAEVLLDQRVACGVGNVWRCELLFLAALDPFRAPAEVPAETWTELWTDARTRLAERVATGGERNTTGRDDVPTWVYGRAGRPCLRCGTPIRTIELGRDLPRRLYWCPTCQRGAG